MKPKRKHVATGEPVGGPKLFKTPEDMQVAIDDYMESCFAEVEQKDGSVKKVSIRPVTVTGLALALNTNRQTLLNYRKNYGPEYKRVMERAIMMVHNFAEECLFTKNTVAGVIFNLKNNFSWMDRIEETQTSTTTMNVNFGTPEDLNRG